MVLKFAANLNFLFGEGSPNLASKIRLAHQAGFRAVEIPFPQSDVVQVIEAKKSTGVEIALINIALGSGDYKLGSASIPGAEDTFKQQLSETIQIAKELDCKKIHLMSGIMTAQDSEGHLKTYRNNLKYAADLLKNEGITGLIEPINKYSVPSYFMNSYETASLLLRDINCTHLKLMLDIFHLQHIRGNVTSTFKEMADIIGHIQIAQVPHRYEPDVAGELDFGYVFSVIENFGYSDWIGCEYKPKTTTTDGLKWLSKYGLHL